MKYLPRQYGSALYESVKGKTPEETERMLNSFAGLLKKNRDTALVRKIAECFERYAREKEKIISGVLTSARKLDGRAKSEVSERLARLIKLNELNLDEKFDEDLIGGFKIKAGEIFLDASLKGALIKIRRRVRDSISVR